MKCRKSANALRKANTHTRAQIAEEASQASSSMGDPPLSRFAKSCEEGRVGK